MGQFRLCDSSEGVGTVGSVVLTTTTAATTTTNHNSDNKINNNNDVAQVHEELHSSGGDGAEAQARRILFGLGFDDIMQVG